VDLEAINHLQRHGDIKIGKEAACHRPGHAVLA
jgi:hypothetical protein